MKRKINLIIKRTVDILGSLFCLLLISPVLMVVCVLIKILMPGPIFFFQERVGRDGKVFKIYKLRTMKVDKEAESSFNVAKDKERLTTLGRILRRFKIDEVVQLINVLKGDMSMVGPRPTLKIQTDAYSEYERQRLKMSPGMTGLAQVNGNTSLSWKERISYDIEYINTFSVWLDIKIFFKTILIVVFGEEKFVRKTEKKQIVQAKDTVRM